MEINISQHGCLLVFAALIENGTHQDCKFHFGNGYFKLKVFLELTQSLDVNSVDHQSVGARPYIRALNLSPVSEIQFAPHV